MPDITERYISEKNCDQVVAACRFAFKELNLNVEADYCEDGENHYLAAEEKYNFISNPWNISIAIHITQLGDRTQMTINVEIFRDAIGPWLKNRCIEFANTFINQVKVAENSMSIQVELNPTQIESNSETDGLISEADALKKFAELKDQGIITEEEFNTKKKQILGL